MHGYPGVVHDDLVRVFAAQCVRRGGPHHRVGGRQDHHGGGEGHGRQGVLNIELKFEGGSEDFEGLDSIDWYAPMGLNVVEEARTWSPTRKSYAGCNCLRVRQLYSDIWVVDDDPGEGHT